MAEGLPHRVDDLITVFLIVIQHNGPHLPVALGVIAAGIQGDAVRIHAGQIVSHFCFGNLRIKNVKTQEFIPDQVVLKAPGTLTAESQAVMVAVESVFLPGFCEGKGGLAVGIRFLGVAQLF